MIKITSFLIISVVLMSTLLAETRTAEKNQYFEQLKTKGAEAPITFLPTTFGDIEMNKKIGMVMAIMLEKCGMNNLEFNHLEFEPTDSNFETALAEFGSFAAHNTFQTDYVFYTRLFIEKRSISEIWGIVANTDGEIVWADRQTKNDKAFKKENPQDPMSACFFLTDRFRSQMGLEPMNENAPAGKIEKLSNQESGLPGEEEIKLVEKRAQIFKDKFKESKLVVYPPLILENKVNKECSENLAALLNKHSLCRAFVSENSPVLTFDKSKPGQPAMLWSVARGFQKTIIKDKPDADYALYAHYGYFANRKTAGFIHFIVCDKNGDWVLTDIANSHHEDFQKTDWQNIGACDQFVVNRLLSYLKEDN